MLGGCSSTSRLSIVRLWGHARALSWLARDRLSTYAADAWLNSRSCTNAPICRYRMRGAVSASCPRASSSGSGARIVFTTDCATRAGTKVAGQSSVWRRSRRVLTSSDHHSQDALNALRGFWVDCQQVKSTAPPLSANVSRIPTATNGQ